MKLGWYWKPFLPPPPPTATFVAMFNDTLFNCVFFPVVCGFFFCHYPSCPCFLTRPLCLYSSNPEYIKCLYCLHLQSWEWSSWTSWSFLNKSIFHFIYLFFSTSTAVKARATQVVFLLSLWWQSPSNLTNMMKSESLPAGVSFPVHLCLLGSLCETPLNLPFYLVWFTWIIFW